MIAGETKRNSWIHDYVVAYVIVNESKDLPDSQNQLFKTQYGFRLRRFIRPRSHMTLTHS